MLTAVLIAAIASAVFGLANLVYFFRRERAHQADRSDFRREVAAAYGLVTDALAPLSDRLERLETEVAEIKRTLTNRRQA